MTRSEFFESLESELKGLPGNETNRLKEYYNEIFEDGAEDGKCESEICAGLENPSDIANRVRAEMAFLAAEQKPTPKAMTKVLITVLGIFALPIALPIAISVFAVIVALFITFFALVFSVGATAVSLFVAGVIGLIYGIVTIFSVSAVLGVAFVGTSLVFLGVSVMLAIATWKLIKFLIKLTVKSSRSMYRSVTARMRKGER